MFFRDIKIVMKLFHDRLHFQATGKESTEEREKGSSGSSNLFLMAIDFGFHYSMYNMIMYVYTTQPSAKGYS